MKKLMIAFAIVAMAAGAQAASLSWKIGNISTYNTYSEATPTKVASGANYIILAMYSADTTISATFDTGAVVLGGDTKLASFAPSASGGTGTAAGKAIEADYAVGTYYYVALFNSKGATSESAFDYYAVGQALTGNPLAVSPDTPLSLKWTTAANGYPAYTQTTAAPEPTSGLLLLLGMAGLALKRKRA